MRNFVVLLSCFITCISCNIDSLAFYYRARHPRIKEFDGRYWKEHISSGFVPTTNTGIKTARLMDTLDVGEDRKKCVDRNNNLESIEGFSLNTGKFHRNI